MTSEQRAMLPVKRMWAAVVDQGIADYRRAVLNDDYSEANYIRKQLQIMGCSASKLDRIRDNALRFRSFVDKYVKEHELRRPKRLDCPACHSKRTATIQLGRRNVCASCSSCGLHYIYYGPIREEEW